MVGVLLRDIEARDFRNRTRVRLTGEKLEFIADADIAFASHGEIEAAASAGEKTLDHVVGLEAHTQLVARQARLGDDDRGRADKKTVAEVDGVFAGASLGREINGE